MEEKGEPKRIEPRSFCLPAYQPKSEKSEGDFTVSGINWQALKDVPVIYLQGRTR